ncbi:MAG: hypothetical protein VYA80_00830 [Pseudomonadota bacterium]|nr:hypothetical protein [Pseudomonadota bacterium]
MNYLPKGFIWIVISLILFLSGANGCGFKGDLYLSNSTPNDLNTQEKQEKEELPSANKRNSNKDNQGNE